MSQAADVGGMDRSMFTPKYCAIFGSTCKHRVAATLLLKLVDSQLPIKARAMLVWHATMFPAFHGLLFGEDNATNTSMHMSISNISDQNTQLSYRAIEYSNNDLQRIEHILLTTICAHPILIQFYSVHLLLNVPWTIYCGQMIYHPAHL